MQKIFLNIHLRKKNVDRACGAGWNFKDELVIFKFPYLILREILRLLGWYLEIFLKIR